MAIDTTTSVQAVQTVKELINDDLIKLIGQTLGGALAVALPVLYIWLKDRAKSVNWTKEKMDIQALVQDRLIEMRVKFDVDRVAVIEFSNSDRTVNGFPFLFETMTFEKTNEHIVPIKEKFNKVPTSWFISLHAPFISNETRWGRLCSDGSVYIDGKFLGLSESVGSTLRSLGIKELIKAKLTSDVSDGFISLTNHNENINLTNEQVIDFLADVKYVWYNMAQRPK